MFSFAEQEVVAVDDGAKANIDLLDVHDMTGVGAVVSTNNPASEATVTNANIRDINIATEADAWLGFRATEESTLNIRDTTVSDVTGSRAIFSAFADSEINIERVDVINSVGADVSS